VGSVSTDWFDENNWLVGGQVPIESPGQLDVVNFDGNSAGNCFVSSDVSVRAIRATAQNTRRLTLGDDVDLHLVGGAGGDNGSLWEAGDIYLEDYATLHVENDWIFGWRGGQIVASGTGPKIDVRGDNTAFHISHDANYLSVDLYLVANEDAGLYFDPFHNYNVTLGGGASIYVGVGTVIEFNHEGTTEAAPRSTSASAR
jgi:hypothetical protein